ncbi:putative inactive receptor kinase [Hibiscus syriacus]|uniref:Inactive receptor kinase n=1 Tax=Hibiscus syriacus TaxID=106335 RepID=A0A6A2XNI6_HIBSY|nr:putative inactive receptor kinase [Hibiscus syriacus]
MLKQFLRKLPRKSQRSDSLDSAGTDPVDRTSNSDDGVQCTNFGNKISSRLRVVKRVSSAVFPASIMAASEAVEPNLAFNDVSNPQKPNLFISKLNLCCEVCNSSDPDKTSAEQDLKRQTLIELVDFVSSGSAKFNEPVIAAVLDDEEPMFDPGWSSLQLVYDLLLQFIGYSSLDVKAILRKTVNNIIYSFVYETERHSGIAELLEIFGSIISGFALPLKEEHKMFLCRALIPLHKPKSVGAYHQQLTYCVIQFVDKDPKLANNVITGLLNMADFQKIMVPLFLRMACCLNSFHYQIVYSSKSRYSIQSDLYCDHPANENSLGVAERAHMLWNNERVLNLIRHNRQVIFPLIFPALERNSRNHWNQTVLNLTKNTRKTLFEMDEELVAACECKLEVENSQLNEATEKRKLIWECLEIAAGIKPAAANIVPPTKGFLGTDLNGSEALLLGFGSDTGNPMIHTTTRAMKIDQRDDKGVISGRGRQGSCFQAGISWGKIYGDSSSPSPRANAPSPAPICWSKPNDGWVCLNTDDFSAMLQCLMLNFGLFLRVYKLHGSMVMRKSWFIEFKTIFREANSAADFIAKQPTPSDGSVFLFDSFLSPLLDILHRDIYVSVLILTRRVNSEPVQDKQALLAFISNVKHANRIQWNSSTSACDWVGVECDANRSFVYSLRLPGVALIGSIPPNTIGRLSQLRILSLRSNRLSGEIPADFSNLILLHNLYLQGNEFTGWFPRSVTRLTRLTRLDLSSNNFTGSIPLGVNNLSNLTRLFLQNNKFSGSLPGIDSDGLSDFNVSYNNLNGSIPDSLSKFPESSFAGNLGLCGHPLRPCNPLPPSPAPSKTSGENSKKLSNPAIIAIAVGSAISVLLLLLLLIICLRKRRPPKRVPVTATVQAVQQEEAGTSSSKDDITGVLGKGSVGTSYKVVLAEGTTVVVKRLKDVAVGEREFDMQLKTLSKIQHENVLPLRAFYYSQHEKLLVSDFMPHGSLCALLHGSMILGHTPLHWDHRIRAALTVARGLAYLHDSVNMVHGNLKSSNVLLRPDHEACISDFGLNPLFSSTAQHSRIVGYRAPEVIETCRVLFKSDVYSFGVLLLELLTGKSPDRASITGEVVDLPLWVQSVVREECTADVFDVELMAFHSIEEEMVRLLEIAIDCISTIPDRRPTMSNVVRMIEDMRNDGNG